MSKTLIIRLDTEMMKDFKSLVETQGKTMSKVVRNLIKSYIETEKDK